MPAMVSAVFMGLLLYRKSRNSCNIQTAYLRYAIQRCCCCIKKLNCYVWRLRILAQIIPKHNCSVIFHIRTARFSFLPAPKKDKKAPASGNTGGGGFAELWLMKKVFGRYRYAAFAPFFLLAMVSSISTPTPRATPMMEEMTSGAMSSRAAINRATRSKGLKLRLK